MVKGYVPDRGDIIWIQFDPQSGREQAGLRPALILSPRIYNFKVGLALMCPITSKVKHFPFEVMLDSKKISGVVLSDQVKNLDWRTRKAEFICKASSEVLYDVLAKLNTLLN